MVSVEYVGEIPTLRSNIDGNLPVRSSATPETEKTKNLVNCYIDWQEATNSNSLPNTRSKWIVLIILAVILGYADSIIDLCSVVLNDLKKGICVSSMDQWSWMAPYLTCPTGQWRLWLELLIGSDSKASHILFNLPIYFLLAALFALIATHLTSRAPSIRLLGLPEIKVIILGLNYDLENYLGVRTLLYKTGGLILVVASGIWLGKEGPLVHVACCVTNIVYEYVISKWNGTSGSGNNEFLRRELLSALAATGISVAFMAPIGGVLFMLEFLQSFWIPTAIMWNSFVASMVAVVVVSSFKIFTDGKNFSETDLFQVEFGNFSWLFTEFIPFTILGILGGVYGNLFNKFNNWFYRSGFRQKLKARLCQLCKVEESKYGAGLEVLFVLAITTLLNYPWEITRLPLHVYVKTLFTACPDSNSDDSELPQALNLFCKTSPGISIIKLIFIFVQGFVLLLYSFGLSLPGGVLMPSLALGATIGRALGLFLEVIQNSFGWKLAECTVNSCLVSPSSYAVVGAASFMTGITKLTMCVVVLIFELTGAVSYVLPIMISVMILKFVSDYLCNTNIYDQWLKEEFNKVEIADRLNSGKGSGICDYSTSTQTVKSKLPVVAVLRIVLPLENIKCIEVSKTHSFDQLWLFVNLDNHQGYPLISSFKNPVLLGYVEKAVLINALEKSMGNIDLSNDNSINNRRNSKIKFELSNFGILPHSVISEQLQIEIGDKDAVNCILEVSKSPVNINNDTPLLTVLELFEKMHLNWCIVTRAKDDSDIIMTGFIDRYILADLIDLEFDELKHEIAGVYDMNDIEGLLYGGGERDTFEI